MEWSIACISVTNASISSVLVCRNVLPGLRSQPADHRLHRCAPAIIQHIHSELIAWVAHVDGSNDCRSKKDTTGGTA